jgi:transmembrane E3 ubiquitin-protein ligase
MEGPRLVLLIVVFFFLFVSPDTKQPSPSQQKELGRRIEGLQQALSTLRNGSYGDFDPAEHRWLNSTGLRKEDGFNWRLLLAAQKAARIQLLQLFVKSGGVTQKDLEEGDPVAYESVAQESLPLYQNVSGDVRGKFLRRPVPKTHSQVNLTALGLGETYVTDEFQRNVTESEGEIKIRLVEDIHQHEVAVNDEAATQRTARRISAEVAIITDSSPSNGWEMKLYGAHFLPTGSILLTTTSEKFTGIFSLPSFALSEADYHLSRDLLNTSLTETVSKWERNREATIPFSSSPNNADVPLFPVPSCEYIIYLHQHPVNFVNSKLDSDQIHRLVAQIEEELRYPDGASLPQPPPMTFSAIVYSPDCGFILETESSGSSYHLSGPKSEIYWTLLRRLIIAFIIVLGMQVALLKRQMDEASTPSTRSRIAYQSIGIMAYGDGLIISGFVGFLILNDSASLMVMAASFLCLLNVAFFEMKFIFDIWTVQVGDPRQHEREREQRAAAAAPPASNAATGLGARPAIDTSSGFTPGLPLPVTAPRPLDTGATSIILPPDQDIDAAQAEDDLAAQQTTAAPPVQRSRGLEFSAIYTRFYFTLIVLMFFSLWAFSWPRALRSAYVDILCFAYLSFWTPQIYRNVMRNCRQALKWEYVIGISILRLTPIVYCYTKQNNTLSIDVDWTAAYILVGWVWLQVLALASQQFLGPRLFVKESWCPPAYDYHPLLQDDEDDVEAGANLPIGFVASASQAKDKDPNTKENGSSSDRKIFDCAICMNEIDVPVVLKASGKERSGMGSSWLERRNYMVTPCRHIFHSACLEGWMRLRLVCPICREGLPPL